MNRLLHFNKNYAVECEMPLVESAFPNNFPSIPFLTMKSPLLLIVGFSLATATLSYAEDKPAAANPAIVTYNAPEKFTDFTSDGFGMASDKDLKYLTELFTTHIENEAKRCLTAGERLEITFKDIDLAGRYEPERGPSMQNVRIYRDITYPRMVFTFKVYGADGQVRVEGERKLMDMNYNMKLRLPSSDQEYRPDKELLSDWMRAEIMKKKS